MRSIRNSAARHGILHQVEQANSEDAIYVITGNLSGHDGKSAFVRRQALAGSGETAHATHVATA